MFGAVLKRHLKENRDSFWGQIPQFNIPPPPPSPPCTPSVHAGCDVEANLRHDNGLLHAGVPQDVVPHGARKGAADVGADVLGPYDRQSYRSEE